MYQDTWKTLRGSWQQDHSAPYRTMVQLNVVYRWIEIPTAESEKILLTFCKNKIWKLSHRTS
jgi:hypothetical protein